MHDRERFVVEPADHEREFLLEVLTERRILCP